MSMADYRIIPSHPWEAVRERYRELASQVRPGDPRAVPFEPRRTRFAIRTAIQFAACALFTAAAWLIFLNA